MENLMDNPVDEQQEAQGQDEQLEQSQQGTPQEQEQPEFMLDKDGNFTWNTDEYDEKYPDEDSQPEQEEEQPEADTEDDTQQEQEEEPRFKVKVDGEEIEVTQDELLRGYMRQRDYTQKTQQLAEQRKQFEQYQPQQQQYQPQYQNQHEDSRGNQQGNVDLNAMAKDIAARQLGLESADDLSELDFNHITAVVEAKQALINQRNSMMMRQQNIDNLEAQLRSEEPRYDDIMKNIGDVIQNLPVGRYQKLQKAYNEGNPEPLRELFKEMQKEYYAKSIKKVESKKTPVPVVEHATNTPVVQTKRGKKIDYAAFGRMSTEQKSKVLLDLGLLD